MPATTYLHRNIAKLGSPIAGGGDFASAASAAQKVELLEGVRQECFQNGREFKGQEIRINDVDIAIDYVIGKKLKKAARQTAIGTIRFTAVTAGTMSGATVGSIIPGAGTLIGGVAVGTAASGLITVTNRIARITRHYTKKNQGDNRKAAAFCLFVNATSEEFNEPMQFRAARLALQIILGEEFDKVMEKGDLGRIEGRMKSV